ncbi:MAG TPA: hypothetical protein VG894_03110 [Bauldia sp.]|nr:hypothetical protein [Bauldia sp.]
MSEAFFEMSEAARRKYAQRAGAATKRRLIGRLVRIEGEVLTAEALAERVGQPVQRTMAALRRCRASGQAVTWANLRRRLGAEP